MSTIPDLQIELLEVAGTIEPEYPATANRIRRIVQDLYRRKAVRPAPATQGGLNRHLAEEIRAYAREHPETTEFDIGRWFQVNQGRVSEALHGKRK